MTAGWSVTIKSWYAWRSCTPRYGQLSKTMMPCFMNTGAFLPANLFSVSLLKCCSAVLAIEQYILPWYLLLHPPSRPLHLSSINSSYFYDLGEVSKHVKMYLSPRSLAVRPSSQCHALFFQICSVFQTSKSNSASCKAKASILLSSSLHHSVMSCIWDCFLSCLFAPSLLVAAESSVS